MDDSQSRKRRRRRSRQEIEEDRAVKARRWVGKKKPGRPSKADIALRHAVDDGDDAEGASGGKFATEPASSYQVARKDGHGRDYLVAGDVVHGFIDGLFPAGYFLRVPIKGTSVVLQGVLFKPGAYVPVTKSNDAAPAMRKLEFGS